MAGRKIKIRDDADARACLAAMERSALPLAKWAQAHGIDGRSLHAWRHNLGSRRGESVQLRMVELTVAAPVQRGRYIVHLGDLAVEVDEHFDPETLRRLLDAVAEC